MSVETQPTDRFSGALQRLEQLCQFTGAPKQFWQHCMTVLGEAVGARGVMLLKGNPEELGGGWKRVMHLPAELPADAPFQRYLSLVEDVAERCIQQGEGYRGWENPQDPQRPSWCLGVRMANADGEAWVATFFLGAAGHPQAEEALRRLRLLAHLPLLYSTRQEVERSEIAVAHFAEVLELLAKLNEHSRFVATAMAFVNELAARHQCDRISLGWVKVENVELKAMSGAEKFDRRSEAVRALEEIMEEALDQDEVISWPAQEGQISRAHAKYAEERKTGHICSLPLHLDEETIAVLTCERERGAFAPVEMRLLSLCGDMCIRRLAELHKTDRWFGARWAMQGRKWASKFVGPEHTGAKALAILGALGLLVLLFGRMEYRVESPFSLRAKSASLLSAPFAGFLESVNAEVGDAVEKDQPLASLDIRDLLLEEASSAAEQTRYEREAEKAAGQDKPAEMGISQAMAEQARAKLEIVRFRRQQAALKAPFRGVVVEGDLKKRLGTPVKQGDVLIRVAQLEDLTVECLVSEQDIHELKPGNPGEIAFASAPKVRFPVKILRIEPAAQTHEHDNSFKVICVPERGAESWWRPGMSGVAKLTVGRRSIGWVVTHRTVDFLRLHLWW